MDPDIPKGTDAGATPRRDAMVTDDERWLDRPGSVDTVIRILLFLSVASVLADFSYEKHGHWGFQNWFGFDAAYGFVACVALVLAAKGLRVLLMRGEDYYD